VNFKNNCLVVKHDWRGHGPIRERDLFQLKSLDIAISSSIN